MKKTILALNILLGLVNTAHADDFSFRLRNALAFGRNGETVTVAVPGGTNLAASSLTDEHGTVVLSATRQYASVPQSPPEPLPATACAAAHPRSPPRQRMSP